jgi:hypothetical protein
MARVYYVGDWAVLTGPVFAETPFHYSHKGLDIFNSSPRASSTARSSARSPSPSRTGSA